MRVCYGTTPGYWSTVSADRFESARDYIFEGVEEEYAGLIKKINDYHEKVGSKLTTLYKDIKADGVNVSIIAKYGYQLYPVVYNADRQSDMIVTCEQQHPVQQRHRSAKSSAMNTWLRQSKTERINIFLPILPLMHQQRFSRIQRGIYKT